MNPARASLDLLATAGLALLGLIGALLPLESWIRVVLLLPLVFYLPGYALLALLLRGDSIGRTERLVYAIALSTALTALSGILVQLALPLDRYVWGVVLAGLTLALAYAALRRREAEPGGDGRRSEPLPRPGSAPLAAIAVAVAIAVAAIEIASDGARDERDAVHFSELWALPQGGEEGTIAIGVENREGRAVDYAVTATRGNRALREWRPRLDDGARWEASLALPSQSGSTAPLRVVLSEDGRPLRNVFLREGELR